MNPLEVTHFKAGFLRIPSVLRNEAGVLHGISRPDSLSSVACAADDRKSRLSQPIFVGHLVGEYYRSVKGKRDFYNLFDYWSWNEAEIERAIDGYGWERAIDTELDVADR
jgi:hypothetical protein